jgi:hypothetical protein
MRSSHIIYVDESGSPVIGGNAASYPVFVLAFCIFEVDSYVNEIEPAFQAIKFEHFGHDLVIFHESEIRKREGSFRALHNNQFRVNFLEALSSAISQANFQILPIISEKNALPGSNDPDEDVYFHSAISGIKKSARWVASNGCLGRELVFAFESRGAAEDRALLSALQLHLPTHLGTEINVKFVPKAFASTGLQIADLVARPIGLSVIRPGQPNRSFDAISHKLVT